MKRDGQNILERGREIAERQFAEGGFVGNKNAYECDGLSGRDGCGGYIVTVDVCPGVTPFMLKCGRCGAYAHSKMYRVADYLIPTHEWYRPESLGGVDPVYYDHLSNGGLILRPISGGCGNWLPPIEAKSSVSLPEMFRMMRAAAKSDVPTLYKRPKGASQP